MAEGNGKWRSALEVLGWMRPRPEPSGDNAAPRVSTTPPSDDPGTVLEYLERALEDIEAVLEHDPAARHALEVVLAYPGLHAVWLHRIAHGLWKRGLITAPRVLANLNRSLTGIEIHPGARIGRRVFIDHGMGIVVGETATVGDECLLYKGVVLGGTSLARKERHPTLGRGVVVGSNACILGPIQIGDYAKVGSNSVVVRDVPEEATVVGVPGKIARARREGPAGQAELLHRHADLPDPVANVLQALVDEIEALRRRLDTLEGTGEALHGRDDEMDEFDGG
jgi:serine O-acetyltransferase